MLGSNGGNAIQGLSDRAEAGFRHALSAAGDGAQPRGLESFPDWKVGDSITKITPEGNYPKWYAKQASEKASTVQGRYWMNRAASAQTGEFTSRQLSKMRAGFAPQARVAIRNKGGRVEIRTVSKELHHDLGRRGTPGFDEPVHLREVWPWEREAIDKFRHTGYDFLDFWD